MKQLAPFDPARLKGVPEQIVSMIKLTEAGTSAFVIGWNGEVIGWANSYTEALRLLVSAKSTTLVADINRLCIETVTAMEHKLLVSELKRNFQGSWASPDWQETFNEHFIEHVKKGDPIDVIIYGAFAAYHGWSLEQTIPEPVCLPSPTQVI